MLGATAPIGPLAWEPLIEPLAVGAAPKMAKRQKKKFLSLLLLVSRSPNLLLLAIAQSKLLHH